MSIGIRGRFSQGRIEIDHEDRLITEALEFQQSTSSLGLILNLPQDLVGGSEVAEAGRTNTLCQGAHFI